MNYAYMMVPYITAENSSLDKGRVFKISRKMMKGHKWEAFVLGLSFLGWNILGALTGQKGIATAEELPGVVVPEVEIPFV